MNRKHGGWNDAELQSALGAPTAGAAESDEGRQAFLFEADKVVPMPEGQEGDKPTGEPAPAPKTVDLKAEAIGRKFSGKLNKMKKGLAEKLPKAMNKAIKAKGPEWQLDTEDSEMLSESVENCFEILDIDFQIQPISAVLKNPLWVLLLPLFVLVLIFIPKAIDLRQAQLAAAQTVEASPNEAEKILTPN